MSTTTTTLATGDSTSLSGASAFPAVSYLPNPLVSPSFSGGKRRKEDSQGLDCQSLRFSLKRVRLSGSPGELRLHHDLRSLTSQGWTQVEKHMYELDDASNALSMFDAAPLQPSASSRAIYGRCGHEHRHDLHHHPQKQTVTLEQGVSQDPLRLALNIGNQARVLIFIPRTYPHRPPIVSQITYADDCATINRPRQITINNANPAGHMATAPTITSNVVVFNHWSPIMRLGDLLGFIVDVIRTTNGKVPVPGPSSDGGFPAPARADSVESRPSHREMFGFMEGQKIGNATDRRHITSPPRAIRDSPVLDPTRFEAGYGKYSVPIASAAARSTQRDPADAEKWNAMSM